MSKLSRGTSTKMILIFNYKKAFVLLTFNLLLTNRVLESRYTHPFQGDDVQFLQY